MDRVGGSLEVTIAKSVVSIFEACVKHVSAPEHEPNKLNGIAGSHAHARADKMPITGAV